MTRRPPRSNTGFSWGRFPLGDTGLVSYRLFRRDWRGSLHMQVLDFRPGMPRPSIAAALWHARRVLRDRVDEIDLAAMGVAA